MPRYRAQTTLAWTSRRENTTYEAQNGYNVTTVTASPHVAATSKGPPREGIYTGTENPHTFTQGIFTWNCASTSFFGNIFHCDTPDCFNELNVSAWHMTNQKDDNNIRNDGTDVNLTTGKIVAVIFISILNVFMLLGNMISIITIAKTPSLRRQTYYWFVLNLAIVDLLNSLTVVPINSVWEVHGAWPFGQGFCNIIIFLDIAFSAIASYSTVLVSVDKFIYITRPFLYHHTHASKVAIISVISVWITWLSFSAVSAFGGIARNKFLTENETALLDPCNFAMTDNYAITSAIVSFFIPLVLIMFTSIKIIWIAQKHIRRIAANRPSIINDRQSLDQSRKYVQRTTEESPISIISTRQLQQKSTTCETTATSRTTTSESTIKRLSKDSRFGRTTFPICKAFGTVMIVTLFFILMFAPYWFAAIIDVSCGCIPPYVFEDYLTVFYYMHSLVNPYIYMATDRRYKNAIRKLYYKYFKKNRIQPSKKSSLVEPQMKSVENE